MSTATNSKQRSKANQIVIQCPSCQTKFALDASVIEGIEEPRFHCSRCDHLFGLDKNGLANARKLAESTLPKDAPSWENPKAREPRRRLEIPGKPAQPLHASAPHEVDAEGSEEQISDTQMSFDFSAQAEAQREQESADQGAQAEGGKGKYYIPRFSIRQDVEEAQQHSRQAAATDTVNEALPATDAAEYEASLPEPRLTNSAAQQRDIVPQPAWRSFAFLAAVLMGFLSVLGVFALYIRSGGESAHALVSAIFPAGERAAPAGLYIKNTRFRRVVLDGGETVFIVSGRVVNQSKESFDNVTVEALAFDGAGSPLIKTKAALSSTLAEKRVRSLTPDMIRTIQQQGGLSFHQLRIGDSEEFAIALADGLNKDDLLKARYFSARVYSVR